ncbi:ParB/RepB/Spo0J family partition protein [Parenemella sanctibonifatiensis]|uniref:Chromosome partitioning protein ParB n=1 Tax=Parenemella sanctibonifatiensis TaxID=2016505 RepID=A0A255EFH8_9ACTN|nr:ParB/RepB/Spo0J family partition protein [Parenemella sanctibonifatiensis]OYN90294.1 chromosome partitioning protein ParB [Parenemella sanctibonifatiensis]
MAEKKNARGLGRGLGDLFQRTDEQPGRKSDALDALASLSDTMFADVPVDRISPNPHQPRTVFQEEELEELAASIGEVGVLQPIVVRRSGEDFELIMGERRWRASQLAGLERIPAIVRSTADTDMLRDALLENLHRVQLNPLEEAAAYQQMLTDFDCTQEELSQRVKRSRSRIANTLRLLKLPPTVQRRVAAGTVSAGHARALLGLEDPAAQERLAQRIVAENLSVRAVEELVTLGETGSEPVRQTRRVTGPDPRTEDLQTDLADHFDTRVKVRMSRRGKGRISIEFASEEDLERIVAVLHGRTIS